MISRFLKKMHKNNSRPISNNLALGEKEDKPPPPHPTWTHNPLGWDGAGEVGYQKRWPQVPLCHPILTDLC